MMAKAKRNLHKELLASDVFATYSLRSTFFLRRLRGFSLWEAIDEVARLQKVRAGFVWDSRKDWGIEEDAWSRLAEFNIDPLLIFCHPRLITEQPRLLLYYRTVALISQKGLSSLAPGNIAGIEAGNVSELDAGVAREIATALNGVVCAVINAAADLQVQHLPGLQFAAAGATVQGSWNNAIGAEGEAAVRTVLVNQLRNEIASIVMKDGRSWDYDASEHARLIDSIADVKIIRLKQGYHLRFGSEPDISLRNPNDEPVVAIEVKAGTDPAGALERLGAAMKSFENDRSLNARVKTVYIVRALTPELRKRISEDNPFDHTFGLTELLSDERTQKRFGNLLLRAVLGKVRR